MVYSFFNPNSRVGIVGQQNFSNGLFWIEGIASYFETQNGSKCLILKKNEVKYIFNAESGFNNFHNYKWKSHSFSTIILSKFATL